MELLVHIGDSTNPVGFRDGGIMQRMSQYHTWLVHAESICRGRNRLDLGARKRQELDRVYKNLQRKGGKGVPLPPERLAIWWDFAKGVDASLDAAFFTMYPFTRLERSQFLVVPLTQEVTPLEMTEWPGKDSTYRFGWREHTNAGKVRIAGDPIREVRGRLATVEDLLAKRMTVAEPAEPTLISRSVRLGET